MSEFGIPIIEPTVDYTKVPAIQQKRTIAFINHFIVHTVTFLNKFTLSCEERLFEFENKLQKVEASLQLLEARLSSIPGLEGESPTQTDSSKPENETTETKLSEVDTVEETKPSEPKPVETETQPISKDPRYAKYFKMVQVGVPVQGVRLKMQQEGLDPTTLDDPDRQVPKIEPVESPVDND